MIKILFSQGHFKLRVEIISKLLIFCWTLKAISRSDGVPVSPQGAARWFLRRGVFWNAWLPSWRPSTVWKRSTRRRRPNNRIVLPLLLSLRRHSLRRTLFPGKLSYIAEKASNLQYHRIGKKDKKGWKTKKRPFLCLIWRSLTRSFEWNLYFSDKQTKKLRILISTTRFWPYKCDKRKNKNTVLNWSLK